jgi:hypothetical protein
MVGGGFGGSVSFFFLGVGGFFAHDRYLLVLSPLRAINGFCAHGDFSSYDFSICCWIWNDLRAGSVKNIHYRKRQGRKTPIVSPVSSPLD